jgi:hypothetical protein
LDIFQKIRNIEDSLADRRGPAGSALLEATDRIVAERLEATILGNI